MVGQPWTRGQMGIELLKSKYSDGGSSENETAVWVQPEQSSSLERWQDSETVVELSEVLKKYAHHGVRLIWSVGAPVLRFNPPLSLEDSDERWEFANYVTALAVEARRDLITLVNAGLLRLSAK